MENQGDPRAQKSKKSLKVFTLSQDIKKNLRSELRGSQLAIQFELDVENCDIELKFNHPHQYLLEIKNGVSISLPLLGLNLKNALTLASEQLHHGRVIEDESERESLTSATKNKKQFVQSYAKLEQVLAKGAKKNLELDAHRAMVDERWIEESFDESFTLDSILPQILKLSGFQNFQVCQILHHEKGKPEAESYSFQRGLQVVKESVPVNTFNNLFQIIKKSKNKNFNQSQLMNEQLHFTGSFIAREIEYREHNILFFVSRSDFLPTTASEQLYLDSLLPVLNRIFEFLLLKTKLTDKEKSLLTALNHYPYPLGLRIGENYILKNKAFHPELLEKYNLTEENCLVLGLGYDRSLITWKINSEETITDLNHHQRISLLGELLNTLKHELSNPLFGIKLTAEILSQDDLVDEDGHELLGEIANSSRRCQEIISNFSNLYADADTHTAVKLSFLIKETMTLAKSETRGLDKKFINEISDDDTVKTHPTWLTQILFNLIINASQAVRSMANQQQGKILITLNKNTTHYIISVADNGPGIPEDKQNEIFKPYYTTKTKGTGLGLPICKRLAKRLGAELTFHNNNTFPGVTFSISLKA